MVIIRDPNKPIMVDRHVIDDVFLSHSALGLYVRIIFLEEKHPSEPEYLEKDSLQTGWQDAGNEFHDAYCELIERGFLKEKEVE